jgi:hypothetical protein
MIRARNLILSACAMTGLLATSVVAVSADTDPITPEFQRDVNNALAVTDSTVRRIDLFDLDRGNIAFSIPIDGFEVSVEMWPHSVRSAGYRVIEQREDGSFVDVEPSAPSTYRGIVSEIPGAVVAGSVIDGQVFSMVVMPDGARHWVEPLASRFPGTDPALHAVYSQQDVLPSLGMCAVVEEFIQKSEQLHEDGQAIEAGRGFGDCGGLCIAQCGADADFEFYQAFGSNTANVENVINNIMNSVNTLYENQVGITHEIEGIIVRTAEPDPYSSTNAGTLLSQVRSEWLNNIGGSIPHDTAQLFTAKNLQGSTIGIAYLGGVCNSLRYSVVETTCCGSFSCRTDLTAHELGHNWDATHISGSNSTMNPSLVCANNFVSGSRSEITSYRNSVTCLDPAPPASGPGTFSLVSPAPGAQDVVLNPLLDWSDAQDAQFYRISLADNPDFVNPRINEFSTSQTQLASLPPNFLDENTDYYWKVTAVNAAGETSSNPVVSVFTTFGEDPVPCDGDATGDLTVDLADLNLVLANFGSATSEGDVSGDGLVDLADLNLVLANFGSTCQ